MDVSDGGDGRGTTGGIELENSAVAGACHVVVVSVGCPKRLLQYNVQGEQTVFLTYHLHRSGFA